MEVITIGIPPIADTARNLSNEFIIEIPIIISNTQSGESIFKEVEESI